MSKRALKAVIKVEPIKLDLGCGPHKKEGFIGVDSIKFAGVDIVHDLMRKWPWPDGVIAEIHMSHTLEHFTGVQRMFIFNEMYRVLQKEGIATVITPSWSSNRAYGDPTHLWPPVSEMTYMYINKKWRDENAPHTDAKNMSGGYNCDLDAEIGWFGIHPELASRAEDVKRWWLTFGKEAAFDIQATITKRR